MGCCKLNIYYRTPLKSYACSYIIILFNVKRIRLAKVTFWNILAAFIIWICYTIGTCIIIMNPMHRTPILCISGIEFSTYWKSRITSHEYKLTALCEQPIWFLVYCTQHLVPLYKLCLLTSYNYLPWQFVWENIQLLFAFPFY